MQRALVIGLALLLVGCSESKPPADKPDADLDVCSALEEEDRVAMLKALECVLGETNQCQITTHASFCGNCGFIVNGQVDDLEAIATRYRNAGCSLDFCRGGGACRQAAPKSCQIDPTSATGARCLEPTSPDAGTD